MSKKHFDIHASIVFRLGAELISDEIQALIELVKNAYDADASIVKININTQDSPPSENTLFPNATGFIEITDNGMGMTEKIIEDGWLFLSNSPKLQFKLENKTTPKGRTPLGDKGLGRLGVQRLGWNVEIITRPSTEIDDITDQDIGKEHQIGIDWREYIRQVQLSKVDIDFDTRLTDKKPGTQLIVSDLQDAEIWKGSIAVNKLQVELSKMISPFSRIRDFIVSISIDGTPLELAKIASDIRNTSPLRYFIGFDGKKFTANGKFKLSYLNPSKSDLTFFRQFVEQDEGKSFYEFLKSDSKSKQFNLKLSEDSEWFCEFGFSRQLDNFDGLAIDGNNRVANPGSFEGEIDFFYLNRLQSDQEIFDKASEYKQYVKDLTGIRVYRDGFAIRTDEDWLKLRSSQTSGRSVYVLRPDNTIGYIAISSANNPNLKETTSREDFVQSAYSDNFFEMLRQFIGFTELAQEFIRRGFVSYRKKELNEAKDVSGTVSAPETVIKNFTQTARVAETHQHTLEASTQGVRQILKNETEDGETASPESGRVFTPTEIEQIEKLLNDADESLKYLMELQERIKLLSIVNDQIELLREQLALSYETMGLGLTAEALSHEISRVITNLLYRTEDIVKHITTVNIRDKQILSYVDTVRSSATALRKQLSHFAPSLRYVREKRENIIVSDFMSEIKDYYDDRFKNSGISIKIEYATNDNFKIYMNRGKLTQIIDNLVINSEYWLREALRLNQIKEAVITIALQKPYLIVYDNGRGIEPSVESSLFDPFITTKKSGSGRGLGLFIVQQLLDAEGCRISLLPERNENNRRYKFEINLFARIVS